MSDNWTLNNANDCIRRIGFALGIDQPGRKTFGIGLEILGAIESLKSLKKIPYGAVVFIPAPKSDPDSFGMSGSGIPTGCYRIADPSSMGISTSEQCPEECPECHYSAWIVSVESGERRCAVCEARSERRDALSMERWYRERLDEIKAACGITCDSNCTMTVTTGEQSCGDKVRGNVESKSAKASGNTAGTATDSTCESTPSAERQRQGSSQASDQTSADGNCNSQPPSAPAAESEGNAQHHNAGAKIPDGGPGMSCDLVTERNSLAARLEASRARLAACEERCKELEAGIRQHEDANTGMAKIHEKSDLKLWSLLAPKAEGAA